MFSRRVFLTADDWMLLLLGGLLLLGPLASACEDQHPPVVTTPVVKRTLYSEAGEPVVEMAFDPRGLSHIRTVDEAAASWTRGAVGSGVWDYREWQWWQGHPWGDSCRPRYWTTAQFCHGSRDLAIRYQCDGFASEQKFLLPEAVDPTAPHWDLVISVQNLSGASVAEYHQFFACYTAFNEPHSCWFWAAENRLRKFADLGVRHLDGYVVHPQAYFNSRGAVPHCPRGGGKIVAEWYRPMLLSHPSPAGWRSVIFIEAEYAAGLAQGIQGGAMDYILFPGPQVTVLEDEAAFAVHIRHQLIQSPQLPTIDRLQRLWNDFAASHATIHELAIK